MNDWPHQNDVDAFFGNPRGNNGEVNPAWVDKHIVGLVAPWPLVTAWDFRPVSKIRIHRKCADSLSRVLDAIWQASGRRENRIREWGMHLYAGGFNYRLMKGSTRLSMHSWGCAIDFDSARNTFGDKTPNFDKIPQVLDAFAAEAWTWGGRWKKPDGMHWQAARI